MVNINLSKTQLSKIMQSRRFIGTLLGPLKVGLLLIEKCTHAIRQKCGDRFGINSGSRCRNS